MKKIAIIQSNYIPWRGYFDMIGSVDEFIIFDDVQYTRRDWRNRNKIKTPQGVQWLTVPVQVKGKYYQRIRDIKVDGSTWASTHWRSLKQNYSRAPHFSEVAAWLEPLYLAEHYIYLSHLNRRFIEAICEYLNIATTISNSWDYNLIDGKTERLAELCVQAGGTEYLTGPAAKVYIKADVFNDCGIKLSWFDYSGYGEYPQLWGQFAHQLTILDLLFNCGKSTLHYMKFMNHCCAGERTRR